MKKRWTKEEDDRLIAVISENSGNLRHAFKLFSDESGRTINAVSFRWYGVLRLRNDVNVCLLTIDKKHKHINSKIVTPGCNSYKMKRGLWNKLINLIFGK